MYYILSMQQHAFIVYSKRKELLLKTLTKTIVCTWFASVSQRFLLQLKIV